MENLKLWDSLFKTPFDQVKAITGKDYSGNSPKPYYIVRLLTETFGPCGIGWGYSIESERFERFSETDTLHVAKIRLWYVLDGKRAEVEQMGQTKATYMTSKGQFKVDEDAPKKSVTDALVKCASYLGAAGDIFSGRWDDSKYVAELRKEMDSPKPKAPTADYISAQRKDDLVQDAQRISKDYVDGNKLDAFARYDEITDTEERLFLWELFADDSKLRTFLNAAGDIKPPRRDELKLLAHKIDTAARGLLVDEAVRLRGQVTDQVEVAFLGNFLSEQTKKFLRDSKKAVPA